MARRLLRHGKASLAQRHGRREHLGQRDGAAAEALDRVDPAGGGARHRHGVHAAQRNLGQRRRVAEVGADALERALGARAARAVEGAHLTRRRVPEEDKHVAADARGARLRHVEARRCASVSAQGDAGWAELKGRKRGGGGGGRGNGGKGTNRRPRPRPAPRVSMARRLTARAPAHTHRRVSARAKHVEAALGRQRLRAGHDALGAVDDAAPRGEAPQVGPGARVKRRRRQGHVGWLAVRCCVLLSPDAVVEHDDGDVEDGRALAPTRRPLLGGNPSDPRMLGATSGQLQAARYPRAYARRAVACGPPPTPLELPRTARGGVSRFPLFQP